MQRGVRFLVLVLFLAKILNGCAHAVSSVKEPITATNKPNPCVRDQVRGEEASADDMIAGLLLIRPLGMVSTVMDTAFFIVTLPFSAAGGNTRAPFQMNTSMKLSG